MENKMLTLHERLDRLDNHQAAHPEYDGAVIRSMARLPILSYLGSYDIFCDFQCITEVREDLPYQVTAQVIADHVWSPEDMTQIVNILAAPIVQIEEAYRQGNSALLPYRKPQRAVFQQERLASRLDGVKTLAGPPYSCHSMPIQRFFRAVSELTGNPDFLEAYTSSILPHTSNERPLFRETVYDISNLQSPERTELLYKILVEPFAALPTMRESEVSI